MGTNKRTPLRGVDDNNKTHPKGVDEHNPNVVAQGNVTRMNKGKATFRLPIVRNLHVPAQEKSKSYNKDSLALARRARRGDIKTLHWNNLKKRRKSAILNIELQEVNYG